jgi:ADP-heptose:LPS heptosyltransferase
VVSRSQAFVADGIVEDMVALGLADQTPSPYGSLPIFTGAPVSGVGEPTSAYLLLHPGSRSDWQTKSWPKARWRALIENLCGAGWPLELVGTAAERDGLESLLPRRVAAGTVDLHTDGSLARLEHQIAHAAGVICHNSGIMHLALAYRRPTVVLTGSSSRQWRASYPQVFNLDSGRCGLACNRRHCPVPGFRARCIRLLTLEAVVEACFSLWGNPR